MKWTPMFSAAAFMLALSSAASAQDVLMLGMSMTLSGPGAHLGADSTWAANLAAAKINAEGGVKAGGKTYKLEIKSYDNLYTAAGGAAAAQSIVSRDHINFIINSQSVAATVAAQAFTERANVLLMTSAWGRSVKGPAHPLTFTNMNTPQEILAPLYKYAIEKSPNAKTVAILNPSDASGQEVSEEAVKQWGKLGVKVVSNDFFDRSTTDFSPIATRILANKPDILDTGASPLPNVGYVLKEMTAQGWQGIKIASAGNEADALINVAGQAGEGTYLGLAATFGASSATPLQRELNDKALAELKHPLALTSVSSWDAIFALKAAIEKANSIDPKTVAAVMPTVKFESSYGPSGFGHKDEIGVPNAMLLPVVISQIKDGKVIELTRIVPAELKSGG
jgi:branched-chain amino acid transport system substrate-binding protein